MVWFPIKQQYQACCGTHQLLLTVAGIINNIFDRLKLLLTGYHLYQRIYRVTEKGKTAVQPVVIHLLTNLLVDNDNRVQETESLTETRDV